MSFRNASRITINGQNTFNHVHGNQLNAGTIHFHSQAATTVDRTEYDEFEYVKRGHVITLKDIGSVDVTEIRVMNGKLCVRERARKGIYTIELVDRQSNFTAFVYEGEDARRVWEEDFQRCSRDRNASSCQLFGLNLSEIPMLIFHHELIPLVYLYPRSPGLWMSVYVIWLQQEIKHGFSKIWVNTSRGVLCLGPDGPRPRLGPSRDALPFSDVPAGFAHPHEVSLPSTIDMLKEGTIFDFLRRYKSRDLHRSVLQYAENLNLFHGVRHLLQSILNFSYYIPEKYFKDTERQHLESFFSGVPYEMVANAIVGLRFDTVYSTALEALARCPQGARTLWRWDYASGLIDRQSDIEGFVRFTLASSSDSDTYVATRFDDQEMPSTSWLSQFPRFVEDGGTEDYFCIGTRTLYLNQTEHTRQYDGVAAFFRFCDGEAPPPIYLFLYPVTVMTVPELSLWTNGHTNTHFWSLDETGQCEMTEDELELWGVPKLAPCVQSFELISWPSSTYTALYDWQVAHGFDPTTSDFARYIELPELEILRARKPRAEEVIEGKEENHSGSWWEAFAGSGISAFAI